MDDFMTVGKLIKHLQTYPEDMLVAYEKFSEQCVLRDGDVGIQQFCEPRPDGWVQDKRPDMPLRNYVLFPGN